jgi:hypothetical protein
MLISSIKNSNLYALTVDRRGRAIHDVDLQSIAYWDSWVDSTRTWMSVVNVRQLRCAWAYIAMADRAGWVVACLTGQFLHSFTEGMWLQTWHRAHYIYTNTHTYTHSLSLRKILFTVAFDYCWNDLCGPFPTLTFLRTFLFNGFFCVTLTRFTSTSTNIVTSNRGYFR